MATSVRMTIKNKCLSEDHGNVYCAENIFHITENNDRAMLEYTNKREIEELGIKIKISNVVSWFNVGCQLDLSEIAAKRPKAKYKRGRISLKLRRPCTTAFVCSSGSVSCIGAKSVEESHLAAFRFTCCLKVLGIPVRFHKFKVTNILGICCMPWAIKIEKFTKKYKSMASYEPELHPGVYFKMEKHKASFTIFATGNVTITGPSILHFLLAVKEIYWLLVEFQRPRNIQELKKITNKEVGKKRKLPEEGSEECTTLANNISKKRGRPGKMKSDINNDDLNEVYNDDLIDGDDIIKEIIEDISDDYINDLLQRDNL